jgi:ribonuclease HI
VTGDVKHHDALNALARGIALVDAGHHGTEKVIVPAMAQYLAEQAARTGERLEVRVSSINTDPFLGVIPDNRQTEPEVVAGEPEADVGTENIDRVGAGLPETGRDFPGGGQVSKVLGNEASSTPNPQMEGAGCSPGATRYAGDKYAKLIIHTDGASRGNPGDAAAGVVILDEQRQPVLERHQYLGKTTNNVAEYQALILALQEALGMGASQVEIRTDSELLARQWSGAYHVRSQDLLPLMQQAKQLAGRLQSCKIVHVPREQNKRADALANRALDEHAKQL